jgi:hypothetical protein
MHSFWSCSVAVAVRAEMERVLQQPVSLASLWLLQPPVPSVRQAVWDVACLAALGAMEHGRRRAWAPHQAQEAAPPAAVEPATVVAHFWRLLDDSISPPLVAAFADQPLGGMHPFLCSSATVLAVNAMPSA